MTVSTDGLTDHKAEIECTRRKLVAVGDALLRAAESLPLSLRLRMRAEVDAVQAMSDGDLRREALLTRVRWVAYLGALSVTRGT